jgi:DNA-binding response OmpR family regulator
MANLIMNPKIILIVDDDVVVQKALSFLLQSRGYDVVAALDGSGAIGAVRRRKPDLILLDINFPPDVAVCWDGFRILEWLRRMDEAKGVPVVIVTAGDVAKTKDRCRGREVAGFLSKSAKHDELLACIQQALEDKTATERPVAELPKTRKILFVDDEDDWRYMVAVYLKDSGYEVISAATAAEALRQAEKITPNLMVVDLNLGNESGLPLMKLLKQKHPQVPILLYTGMDLDQEGVQALLREGADQYLRKGTMGEMVQAIQAAAGGTPQAKPAPEKKVPARTAEPSGSNPQTILLLEDDPVFGAEMQRFLESHGFRVARAASGPECFQKIAASDFDIIICEMENPSLPGEQLYGAVQAFKPHLCQRFIFLHHNGADQKTEEFVDRVSGFLLTKPFPLTELLTAIPAVWKKATGRNGSDIKSPSASAYNYDFFK